MMCCVMTPDYNFPDAVFSGFDPRLVHNVVATFSALLQQVSHLPAVFFKHLGIQRWTCIHVYMLAKETRLIDSFDSSPKDLFHDLKVAHKLLFFIYFSNPRSESPLQHRRASMPGVKVVEIVQVEGQVPNPSTCNS